MIVIRLLRDQYVQTFIAMYVLVLFALSYWSNINLSEVLVTAILIGIGFTSLSYALTKSSKPLFEQKPLQKQEPVVIAVLCVIFLICITFYSEWFPLESTIFMKVPLLKEFFIDSFKLTVLVVIPLVVYAFRYGFNLRDWGISLPLKSYFTKGNILTFSVLFIVLTLFQYYFGNGAKNIRDGIHSMEELIFALPLYFIWLLVFVGIAEEYFFRVFLQSRIAIALNSQMGGIILSSIIFGVAHAPGMYLRGGGIIANLGADPSLLVSIGYSFLVLSVAGFFLSVIWVKTKNFWLIALIHASVDLLPGLSDFISSINLH